MTLGWYIIFFMYKQKKFKLDSERVKEALKDMKKKKKRNKKDEDEE